ncbi:MAG: aminoacyl-tRNA hydrolase [Spirochaetales bacterium]|nr:aminoacyl-tRNA hydrolase [Spirochaetales bacterium]
METTELVKRIRLASTEEFSRSGGPGGQNVNKVNTKVTLRVALDRLDLSLEEIGRLYLRLENRVNSSGELLIHCTETRNQGRNRELALLRAAGLIEEALKPPICRRPTGPSRAARERRLERKHHQSTRKESRRRPSPED